MYESISWQTGRQANSCNSFLYGFSFPGGTSTSRRAKQARPQHKEDDRHKKNKKKDFYFQQAINNNNKQ